MMKRKRWTAAEDAIVRSMYHGYSPCQAIHEKLPHRSHRAIAIRARKLGMRVRDGNHKRTWSQEEEDYLVEKYMSGEDMDVVADNLGRNRNTLYSKLAMMRGERYIPHRGGGLRTNNPGRYTLIKMYWDDGITAEDIAKQYNRTRATVISWMRDEGVPVLCHYYISSNKARLYPIIRGIGDIAAEDDNARRNELIELYWEEGLSLRAIGDELDVTGERIRQLMEIECIDTCGVSWVEEHRDELFEAMRPLVLRGDL